MRIVASAWQRIRQFPFDFSINAATDWIDQSGRRVVQRFKEAWLDLVDAKTAARGGGFKVMLEAMDEGMVQALCRTDEKPTQGKDKTMDKKKVIDALVARGFERTALESMGDDALLTALTAQIPLAKPEEKANLEALKGEILKGVEDRIKAERDAAEAQAKASKWVASVTEKVNGTKLPGTIKGALIAKHSTPADKFDALEADLAEAAKELDALAAATGRVEHKAPEDRMAESLYKGFDAPGSADSIGLRDWYRNITGDRQMLRLPGVGGRSMVEGETRSLEAFLSSTASTTLGNTLGRRLNKEYAATDYGEMNCISTVTTLADFRARTSAIVGGFVDLSTVLEGAAYQPVANPSETNPTYTPVKKGALLEVTFEMFRNDDVGLINRLVRAFGRAARRTHAGYVFDLWKANPNFVDGTTIAHANHGSNLSTAAISSAELTTARQNMFKQTIPGSSERMGGVNRPWFLYLPIELEATVKAITGAPYVPGSANNDANPHFREFGQNDERIIVSPLLTDTNNWYVQADPANVEFVEMGYLDGKREPEFIINQQPNVGSAFTSDIWASWKIRHVYGGTVNDYRGVYFGIVA